MYYVTGGACKGGYDYARHAKGENRTLKRIYSRLSLDQLPLPIWPLLQKCSYCYELP